MSISRLGRSSGDRVFDIVNISILTFFFLLVLYPLIFILSASFSEGSAVVSGRVWLWPVGFNIEGYKAIFEHRDIVTGYLNSLYYMAVGTAINVSITVIAAYPLSRRDFFGGNLIMFLFVFTMLFQGGLVPDFLLVRGLGMYDTRWAMMIPNALAVWNMIITRTYFQKTIPDELLEASKLDGCSDIRFFGSVVLPLSNAIIAVMALYYAVNHWNAFFRAIVFLQSRRLYPLQLVLREVLILNQMNEELFASLSVEEMFEREHLAQLLKYSLIVAASVPVLAIYPFVQKYFVKGIMIGSLKG